MNPVDVLAPILIGFAVTVVLFSSLKVWEWVTALFDVLRDLLMRTLAPRRNAAMEKAKLLKAFYAETEPGPDHRAVNSFKPRKERTLPDFAIYSECFSCNQSGYHLITDSYEVDSRDFKDWLAATHSVRGLSYASMKRAHGSSISEYIRSANHYNPDPDMTRYLRSIDPDMYAVGKDGELIEVTTIGQQTHHCARDDDLNCVCRTTVLDNEGYGVEHQQRFDRQCRNCGAQWTEDSR